MNFFKKKTKIESDYYIIKLNHTEKDFNTIVIELKTLSDFYFLLKEIFLINLEDIHYLLHQVNLEYNKEKITIVKNISISITKIKK